MQTIPLPTKIEINESKENKNKADIIIEPCYPGYGITLGNALRRVLLSSLSGAAIIATRIKGATHEFSTLPCIKEDVLEIILNLKLVRIKSDNHIQEPIVLNLKAKGKKIVKAKDIEVVAGLKITNPDLKIATLTDEKAILDMKLWIGEGKGYSTSEELKKNDFEVGVIVCDAIFTPIVKISLNVENIRVGERTDYDKLILGIETDGTVSPKEALDKSANILVRQFSFIAGEKELSPIEIETGKAEVPEIKEEVEKEEKKKEKKTRGRPKKTK